MATPAAVLSLLVKTEGVRQAQNQVQNLDKTARKANSGVTGFASTSSRGFSRVGVAARGMQVLAGGAVAIMAKNFVTSASDIEESLTKNEQLFGKSAKSIDRWSKTTATMLGISRKEALESAGSFGSLFETIGVSDKPAAKMSKRFTELASDLASFNNSTPTEALEALRSGLIGEAEPMRRFGALLSENRVKTEAYRKGIAAQGAELTEQQKVQARYSLILRDTQQAQGDFARTSGGTANQMRILRARVTDLGAEIGVKLIPFVTAAVTKLSTFVAEMRFGEGTGGAFVGVLRQIAAVISSVISVIASLVNWFRQGSTAAQMLTVTIAALAAGFVAYRVVVGTITAATRAWIAVQTALNVVLTANPIGLVIAALAALGVALVVAYKKSETFRNIVNGAFAAVVSVARGYFNTLVGIVRTAFNAIKAIWDKIGPTLTGALRAAIGPATSAGRALGQGIISGFRAAFDLAKTIVNAVRNVIGQAASWGVGVGRKLVDGIVNGIKSAASGIAGAVSGAIGKVNPFGDGQGIGRKVGTGGGIPSGKGAGNLKGAGKHLAPFAAIGARFGLTVSSGLRRGAVTSSGRPSHHASGNAIDLWDGTPGASAAKMRAFKALQPLAASGRLAELIYTPGGAYSNGSRYTPTGQLAADHFDHIHVAYTGGAGDGLGVAAKVRNPFRDGISKDEFKSFASRVWKRATSMMGVGGAMPPFSFSGTGKGNYAEFRSSSGVIGISPEMMAALASKDVGKRSYGMHALVHEFAHARQKASVMMDTSEQGRKLVEGGAELFALDASHRIFADMGVPFRLGSTSYRDEQSWLIRTTENWRDWIRHGQFGGAKKKVPGGVAFGQRRPGSGGPASIIAAAAKKYGIDPAILWGLYGAESNFGKNLGPSSAGARGPFQFMPGTAKAYGIDPMNFKQAAYAAAKYLATYKKRGTAGMLAAYNAGPAGNPNNPETRAYIPKVLQLAKSFPGSKGTKGKGLKIPGVKGTKAKGPSVYERRSAKALAAFAEAESKGNIQAQLAALSTRNKAVGDRIRKIKKDLGTKGKIKNPATRVRLQQELAQLYGERAGINQTRAQLKAGPVGGDVGFGDEGETEAQRALREAIEAQTRAAEELAAAQREQAARLEEVKGELKRQTDFANQIQQTDNFQLKKYLADVLSGQIGGYGVTPRSYTPGTGVAHSY